MEISNMKNIVVLKNLPSNIIEEAIVVIKPNIKVKQPKIIQNLKDKQNILHDNDSKNKYIIREAEMLVSNYISKIEKSNQKNSTNKCLEKKYKKSKIINVVLVIFVLFSILINLIK